MTTHWIWVRMKKYPTTRAARRYTICITSWALKGGEESWLGCSCPLIAPLHLVPWSLSAPQLTSEPCAPSRPVNPQQSWTTASLSLVSVQTRFGGAGIMTFWALSELLHRDITGMTPGFVGNTGHASLSTNRHRVPVYRTKLHKVSHRTLQIQIKNLSLTFWLRHLFLTFLVSAFSDCSKNLSAKRYERMWPLGSLQQPVPLSVFRYNNAIQITDNIFLWTTPTSLVISSIR